MKKFSPNQTDRELYDLFRDAAENYQIPNPREEKQEQWDKIRTQLAEDEMLSRADVLKTHRWHRVILILLLATLLFGVGEIFTGLMIKQRPMMNTRKNISEHRKSEHIQHADTQSSQTTGEDMVFMAEDISQLQARPAANRGPYPGEEVSSDIAVRADSLKRHLSTKFDTVMFRVNGTNSDFRDDISRSIFSATKHHTATAITGIGNAAATPQAKRKDGFSRWSLAIAVGTNWSGIKTRLNGPAALDVGVMVHHRFAPRWSVESGLLLTSKLYSAGPADYTSSVSYPALFRVDAECRIFDVPINLRYDVMQRHNSMGFISAGLSSVWMQKENYLLRSKVNGSVQTAEYNFFNENKHVFSIVNFSAGYEKTWNRFGLQVSPYAKLPLKGIGGGKVKLASAGVLVSAKYNFK